MTDKPSAQRPDAITQRRVVLVKGQHQWRFEWDQGQEAAAIEAIADIARSPRADFDWFDAAVVCQEMSRISGAAA